MTNHPDKSDEVAESLKDLLIAVTFDAPPKLMNGVLGYEARIPVEFVERCEAALKARDSSQ